MGGFSDERGQGEIAKHSLWCLCGMEKEFKLMALVDILNDMSSRYAGVMVGCGLLRRPTLKERNHLAGMNSAGAASFSRASIMSPREKRKGWTKNSGTLYDFMHSE